MLRAAIYARRSKEEAERGGRELSESVETQLVNGRAYAAAHGWSVVAEFIDDGVSRAEFQRRRGLIDLLNLAERKGFDVAIARDETRMGGDMIRTGLVIQDLLDHGAKLYYYSTGEEVRLDDATARFLVAAKNFSSELEREKIAGRTRENLERKARRGLVAGGVTFGFKNVPGDGGKVRVVHEPEAAIIRQMAARYAAGEGVRAIAKAMNAEGIPSPRAGKRGTGSWSPSAIWSILHNPIYVGRVEWGRTHKTYRRGTKVRLDEHDHELVAIEVPELRILDDATWRTIQERGHGHAERFHARSRGSAAHLLSGLVRCACGGPLVVSNGKVSYDTVKVYGCGWHRDRGNAVCSMKLRRPVQDVDAVVVRYLRDEVLVPRVIDVAMVEVRRLLSARTNSARAELPQLEDDARRLRIEIDRLVEALASGATSAAVASAIADREARLRGVQERIAHAAVPANAVDLGARRLEHEARRRLDDLAGLLGRNAADARRALEQLLPRPLTARPIETSEGKRFEIRGEIGLGTLVGMEFIPVCVPSGTRTEMNGPGLWIPVRWAA